MFRMGKVCRYTASLILVLFLFNIMPVLPFNVQRHDGISETIESPSIRANNPHGPITIDGDANFSATASTEDWSGDGSAQDPYIIENYDITMGPTPEASISITNTRVNYTIRGCNLIGPAATPSYGVYLVNSTYGRIVNNMITNFAHGLNVSGGSRNLVVTGNNISYNSYSIWCEDSDHLTITENHCSHNFFTGIYLSNSDNGIISGNNCSGNADNGIQLTFFSEYNTLTDNICNENTNSGFRLQSAIANVFENNTSNENDVGIWNTASNDNFIQWNIFANNTTNAITDGIPSIWDYNYWSDYGGSDGNGDGIGDTNYVFSDIDHYPLMFLPFPVEWAQLITDQYVEFGSYFDYNIAINCPAPYVVSVNDTNNFVTGVPTLSTFTTLAVGDYPLLVNVTNIYGYFTEVIFTVFVQDTTPPIITSPDDFSFRVGEEYQTIEWNAQDLSPLSYVVLRNGSEVSSYSTTLTSIHFSMTLENYQAGIFNYTMVVTDAYGNAVSDTVIVTIMPRPFLEVMLPWLIVGSLAIVVVIVIVVVLRKRRST
ncbi:MAG: nitrous oxide reductase family maturation protein NosD [Promethearchaeota archaeon]